MAVQDPNIWDMHAENRPWAIYGLVNYGRQGIIGFSFDPARETLELGQAIGESPNSSYFVIDQGRSVIVSVNQTMSFEHSSGGSITVLRFDRAGREIAAVSTLHSGGAEPCHVTLDPCRCWALVSNYSGGTVCSFPIANDGTLLAQKSKVRIVRDGGTAVSAMSRIHSSTLVPSGQFLFVVDQGLHELRVHCFSQETGEIRSKPALVYSLPGSGPRQILFNERFSVCYVVCELTSTLQVLRWEESVGTLRPVQMVSTLSRTGTTLERASEATIDPQGRFLLVLNRGHDSVSVFLISEKDGTVRLLESVPTGGRWPRSIEVDHTGKYVFVVNQYSGTLRVFRLTSAGTLHRLSTILPLPMPVCVRLL